MAITISPAYQLISDWKGVIYMYIVAICLATHNGHDKCCILVQYDIYIYTSIKSFY